MGGVGVNGLEGAVVLLSQGENMLIFWYSIFRDGANVLFAGSIWPYFLLVRGPIDCFGPIVRDFYERSSEVYGGVLAAGRQAI